jgi:hypothetical protein
MAVEPTHLNHPCSPFRSTDYMDYRGAAVTLWGRAGAFAHDAYARNRHLYPGLPERLPIVIGITAYGGCNGLTRLGWEHGPRISLFSAEFKKGRYLVEDTILHEMLHAWLYVTGQDTAHDSETWYSAVRRLSPFVLGRELQVWRGHDRKSVRVPNPNFGKVEGAPKTLVRKVRVDEATKHSDVATWPHPFRPDDFDPGEPISCPTY